MDRFPPLSDPEWLETLAGYLVTEADDPLQITAAMLPHIQFRLREIARRLRAREIHDQVERELIEKMQRDPDFLPQCADESVGP